MKYLKLLSNSIQKPSIIRRYFSNVRKIPIGLPVFISSLTEVQIDMINKYNIEFEIKAKNYNLSEYHKALYIMARILKPKTIIETGVFEGHSSLAFLLALEENNEGSLYSIDLPSSSLPSGKEPGWIVPVKLRKRWDLRLGKSMDLLPSMLEELKEVDVFLHDSEHSYENMYWEYKTAWPCIRKDGLILSHDVSQNAAFRDFAKSVYENYYYMLKNCGGIKRTK
jgi:predicted O-methyltransferase YrrM